MIYINIHTHFKPESDDIWVIRNAYLKSVGKSAIPYAVSNGLHPWFIEKYPNFQAQELEQILRNNAAVAVGECGLDRIKGPDKLLQEKVFLQHLYVAEKMQLPLIIHCVRMYDALYDLVRNTQSRLIVHGYSASLVQTQRMLNVPHLYFSIGIREWKRMGLEQKKALPIERLFLENDGIRMDFKGLYADCAAFYGYSLEKFAEQLFRNASIIDWKRK